MKKIAFSFRALWITLALALATFAEQAPQGQEDRAKQRRTPPGAAAPETTSPQQSPEQRQQYQRLQQQIDELKAAHQDLIAQLKAVHELAVKEKATETAGQIEAMISKRQQAFQDSLRQLEQRQFQLQRAGRGRGLAQPRGKQAPQFVLDSFDGRTIRLSDYKDQIVVLEWINPECPFSRYHHETVQTMADLAKKYKDKGVVWFAVNSTNHTTVEANREFAQKQKLPYPILDDRSGQVGRQYGARNTPHMFIIDKNGAIAYEGAIDNAPLGKSEPGAGTVNHVDKALTELLAGQAVSTPTTTPYGCTVKYAGQQ